MWPNSSLILHNAEDDHNDQNATNGNVIPFIPFHIVQHILLNLDAQSLIKCAFFCRDWNSYISSPDFISHNSRRTFGSKSQILLVDEVRDGRQHSFSLHWDNDQFDLIHKVESPPNFDGLKGRVIGTSNGLVCFSNILQRKFAFWNPAIRKYITLPIPFTDRGEIRVINSTVAFGFDYKSNDFKVVYLAKNGYYEPVTVWIFSYTTWSWKCLTAHRPYCQAPNSKKHTLFVNGVIHWIVWQSIEEYNFILTLDVASEVVGEILLPVGIMGPYGSSCIVQIGDSLAVVHRILQAYDRFGSWSVWVMKHDSWTNVINLREEDYVYGLHDYSLIPTNLLAIKKNQDMILETRGGQIVRYNPTTRAIKLLRQPIMDKDKGPCALVHDYADSLYLFEKGANVNSY